jgi:hypothetical protein
MNCKTENCTTIAVTEHTGLGFLADNLFGPRGRNILDGYCRSCGKNRLWLIWMGLLGIICLLFGLIGLPDWKPLAMGGFVFSSWFGIYRLLKK